MAIATEIEQNLHVLPPQNGTEPEKRKAGRPKGSTKVKNAPPPEDDGNVTQVHPGGIMAEVASIDDWTHSFAYLYRLSPTIDRRSGGRQINIEKFARSFDIDDIMRKHGSGVYKLELFRIDEASGRYVRYKSEKFDILNMDYPPMVPAGDWVDDPENAVWKWAVPKLPASVGGGEPGYPPGFNVAQIIKESDERALRMVEIMTPKGNSALDAVLAQMMQANSPERLIALAQALAPKPDNSMALIVELLRQDLKETREELARIRDKAAPPPQKSLLEQIGEVKELGKALGSGRSSGSTDGWIALAEKALESVPDVIDLVKSGMSKPEPAKGLAAAPADTVAAAPTTDQPAAEQTDEQKARAAIDALWKKHGPFLMAIAPKIVEDYKTASGYDCRDWFLRMHGELRWADIRRDLAPPLLANMYMAHKQLQIELAPLEGLTAFLTEFLTLPGEEPAGAVIPDPVDEEDSPRGGVPTEAKTKGALN